MYTAFSNINRYKRHIQTNHINLRHHSELSIRNDTSKIRECDVNNSTNEEILNTNSKYNTFFKPSVQNETPENITECINNTNNIEQNDNTTIISKGTELSSDLFFIAAAKFSIALHNNNNFTRKIYNIVTETFLAPIVSNLEPLSDHISNFEVKFHLNQFIDNMSKPFALCKSDFLMFKWLLEKLVKFSINEAEGSVTREGNVVTDKVDTKGTLLSLKLQICVPFFYILMSLKSTTLWALIVNQFVEFIIVSHYQITVLI